MYGKDLPNQDVVTIDLLPWKQEWLECDEKLQPKTIPSSLKKSNNEQG